MSSPSDGAPQQAFQPEDLLSFIADPKTEADLGSVSSPSDGAPQQAF